MIDDEMTEDEIEAYLESLDLTCASCGEDSKGAASINDKFYCHEDEGITCYMRASWGGATK